MKNLMLIGKSGCGKTTLCQVLNNLEVKYKKTQSVEVIDKTIDTPGEYIENRFYYKALIVTSADSDVIALVQDSTDEDNIFPPAFATIFDKPVIGIITKIDVCSDEALLKKAQKKLVLAGVEKIFKISSFTKFGLKELIDYLEG